MSMWRSPCPICRGDQQPRAGAMAKCTVDTVKSSHWWHQWCLEASSISVSGLGVMLNFLHTDLFQMMSRLKNLSPLDCMSNIWMNAAFLWMLLWNHTGPLFYRQQVPSIQCMLTVVVSVCLLGWLTATKSLSLGAPPLIPHQLHQIRRAAICLSSCKVQTLQCTWLLWRQAMSCECIAWCFNCY